MRREDTVSGQLFGSSTVSLACITSMCSVQRFSDGHSLRLAFGSFFYLLPPPPLYFSTDKSVGQVPGSIGVGAHGWRALVCQPWGRNSVYGLAVPKVEALGHPGHPPPLSDTVVKFSLNGHSVNTDIFYGSSVSMLYSRHLLNIDTSLLRTVCFVPGERKFLHFL